MGSWKYSLVAGRLPGKAVSKFISCYEKGKTFFEEVTQIGKLEKRTGLCRVPFASSDPRPGAEFHQSHVEQTSEWLPEVFSISCSLFLGTEDRATGLLETQTCVISLMN